MKKLVYSNGRRWLRRKRNKSKTNEARRKVVRAESGALEDMGKCGDMRERDICRGRTTSLMSKIKDPCNANCSFFLLYW